MKRRPFPVHFLPVPIRAIPCQRFWVKTQGPLGTFVLSGPYSVPNWVQGLDLNQRPSGYEPDELPGCSTLQQGRGRRWSLSGPCQRLCNKKTEFALASCGLALCFEPLCSFNLNLKLNITIARRPIGRPVSREKHRSS